MWWRSPKWSRKPYGDITVPYICCPSPKMKYKNAKNSPEFLRKPGIGIEFIQEVNLHPTRSDILGKRKHSPKTSTVEDFFRLYITEEIINYVVTETTLYSRQYLVAEKDNIRPHSTAHQWKPPDRAEILTFIGLLILMGIVHKPKLTMNWSKENIMVTPIFKHVMGRDRFLLLWGFCILQTSHSIRQLTLREINCTRWEKLWIWCRTFVEGDCSR